jgi:hypothetical protein
MEKKYNYTYQIKNLINNKTYIGVHSTDDLDDGYMGSGIQLKPAFDKYGKENFVKTIMCFFDTANEMYEEEKFLVDEEWIKRSDNYNIALGGIGGNMGEEVNKKISKAIKGEKHYLYGLKGKNNPHYGKKRSEETRRKMSESRKGKKNPMYGKEGGMKDKTHTEETKRKISETIIKNGICKGKNNPNFKNKKSELPLYVLHSRYKKSPYQVCVKRKYVGVYPTIEEAVKGRDKYLEKLQQIS